jgi:hypothetical protein
VAFGLAACGGASAAVATVSLDGCNTMMILFFSLREGKGSVCEDCSWVLVRRRFLMQMTGDSSFAAVLDAADVLSP